MVSDRREQHIFETFGISDGYPIEVRARAAMAARSVDTEREAINEIHRVLCAWEESLYFGEVSYFA